VILARTQRSRRPDYTGTRFTLYLRTGSLAYANATYDHAVGWCYRAQGFGAPDKPGYRNTFDIQRELRETGVCEVKGSYAISEKIAEPMRSASLALTAARILQIAHHFE
jgi:hypothetical protein